MLRDHIGISDTSFATLRDVDPTTGMGFGASGYCPCSNSNGAPSYFAYGGAGGTTLLIYVPRYDLSVALYLTDALWSDNRFPAVLDLATKIAHMHRPDLRTRVESSVPVSPGNVTTTDCAVRGNVR